MSEKRRRVWVGDTVYDPNADRHGIVTDVKNGLYVLRPVDMWWGTWTARDPDKLEVTLTREERLRHREER
jgi:hypothetical protein